MDDVDETAHLIVYAEPKFLNREGAAALLRSEFGFKAAGSTLAKWASQGRTNRNSSEPIAGPEFVKCGRFPYYPTDTLRAWAMKRLSGERYVNTSQYRPPSHMLAAPPVTVDTGC